MFLKRLLLLLLLPLSVLTLQAKQYTLVIDAGHGGHDPGAQGAFSDEKNINLKVALAFGRYVERNMPNVKIIYTRKTDVFIPLIDRANIANKNHADFFISIHTNSVPKGRLAYGVETYTMGLRRSDEKFSAALRENEVITYEKDYKQKYNGYDPKSPESLIMFELMHDDNMAESVNMARYIQKSVCAEAGRQNKGVKQDVFLVLRETSMPACLVELGYISTPEEEQFLNSDAGVDRLALGIYKGFAQYSKQGSTNVLPTVPAAPQQDSAKAEPAKPTPEPVKPKPEPTKPTEPSKQKAEPAKPVKQEETKRPAPDPNVRNVYKVQVLSSPTILKAGDPKLKGHKDAKYYKEGGVYKYTIGETYNKQEAFNLRVELLKDFPGAFVITTQNGIRIK